jgi:hypothetical protein
MQRGQVFHLSIGRDKREMSKQIGSLFAAFFLNVAKDPRNFALSDE